MRDGHCLADDLLLMTTADKEGFGGVGGGGF